MVKRIHLAAFDLDGTLLRDETVCEALARRLGCIPRMQEFERYSRLEDIRAAREEMVGWYALTTRAQLSEWLGDLRLAPGAEAGFRLLQGAGIRTAIVSITWEFAVEVFARRLGADYFVGTKLRDDGQIENFWPEDKATWIAALASRLGIRIDAVAGIGDSAGDQHLLRCCGMPFFVGRTAPEELRHIPHHPEASILEIAKAIVATHPGGPW